VKIYGLSVPLQLQIEKKKGPTYSMFNSLLRRPRKLKTFGEMCVVTTKDKIQSKLTDKGTTCMFVGYANDHASDVYRFLNLKSGRIIKSRDVIWLGKSFGIWNRVQNSTKTEKIDDSDGKDEPQKDVKEDEVIEAVDKEKLDKTKREVSKLKSWFNPDPERLLKTSLQERN